jgi:imidazolonepropionase
LRSGTTTIEVKSGYGLSVHDESRSLRIARQVTTETTFLGAHVVPPDASADNYVDTVCGEMLTACAANAKWVDVFCDRGAFDVDQARRILQAGRDAGLGMRMHANQLQHGGGVALGVELGVASCDHCTHLTDNDVEALVNAHAGTVATLLPTAELCTRSPFPDARRLIDAGVTVALASDCNPGSSYTSSMPLVVALGVITMHMTCDEAWVGLRLDNAPISSCWMLLAMCIWRIGRVCSRWRRWYARGSLSLVRSPSGGNLAP